MSAGPKVLGDTSVFIAVEHGRELAQDALDELAVSFVTIAELTLGVLAAATTAERARRLATLEKAHSLQPLSIDLSVASAWAQLRIALRESKKKLPINDSWIAATAIAHHLPLATQDGDYDGVPGLEVIRV